MTARCHNDTCTIHWSEVNVPTPAYQADVQLDAKSLACEGDGIGVVISPNAGNIISQEANGIFAGLPAATVVTLSGNPANKGVGPGADAGAPQESDDYVWQNLIGRDALVLISAELNFDYGIMGPTHPFSYAAGVGQKAGSLAPGAYGAGGTPNLSPFNAMVAMRLKANINAVATTPRKATRVPVSGMIDVSVSAGAERQIARVPVSWQIRVPAGDFLHVRSDCFFEGPSQTVNVIATPAAGGAELAGTGHELFNLQVTAIPL